MSNPARLEGKLAIITGGGSGIGEATAKVFSEAGATVVVTGRRPEPLERVAKEIGGHAITCDVSDKAQVRKMFAQALQITGQIDILLNNAAGRANCACSRGGYGGLDPMHTHQPRGRNVLPTRSRANYGGTEVWLNNQYVFAYGCSRLPYAIRLCS